MTAATELHAGTIVTPAATPFDDALDDLRVTGAVLLHEVYTPPWGIEVPAEPEMRRLLGVGAGVRVVPFHLVRRGGFTLAHPGRAVARLDAHEVAICPSGASHRIGAGQPLRVHSLADILAGDGPAPTAIGMGETELVCGVFQLRAAPLNPLLAALPPLLTVHTAVPEESPLLAHVADMLTLELDQGRRGGFTAARLLEVFCAEAIRSYRSRDGAAASGWFRGLADERVGRAIAAVHGAPGAPWTVASLAGVVAMSPSRFAARFRATAGTSVMAYVAAWRMTVACRMLADSDAALARVASAAGYEDAAAFSRAFKALLGTSPTAWREARRRRPE